MLLKVGCRQQVGGHVVERAVLVVALAPTERFVRESVADKVSLICTDEYKGYAGLKAMGYSHGSVDHAQNKYVVGAIHTNTIEGFWSILKRGVMGTFHKISSKYLPLYVAEFEFRYNHRENEDIFGTAISQC